MSDYNKYLAKSGSEQPAQGRECIATNCPCANELGGGNGGNNDICPHYPMLTIAANLTTLYPPQETVLLTVTADYYSALTMTITGASGSVTTAITPGVQTLTIAETSTVTVVAEGTMAECGTTSKHVQIKVQEQADVIVSLNITPDIATPRYLPLSTAPFNPALLHPANQPNPVDVGIISWSVTGADHQTISGTAITGEQAIAAAGTMIVPARQGIPHVLSGGNWVLYPDYELDPALAEQGGMSVDARWIATYTVKAYNAANEVIGTATHTVDLLPALDYFVVEIKTDPNTSYPKTLPYEVDPNNYTVPTDTNHIPSEPQYRAWAECSAVVCGENPGRDEIVMSWVAINTRGVLFLESNAESNAKFTSGYAGMGSSEINLKPIANLTGAGAGLATIAKEYPYLTTCLVPCGQRNVYVHIVPTWEGCTCPEGDVYAPGSVSIQGVTTVFAELEGVSYAEHMGYTPNSNPASCPNNEVLTINAALALLSGWNGTLQGAGERNGRPYYVAGSWTSPAGKIFDFPVWAELLWNFEDNEEWTLIVNTCGFDWTKAHPEDECYNGLTWNDNAGSYISYFQSVCDPWLDGDFGDGAGIFDGEYTANQCTVG